MAITVETLRVEVISDTSRASKSMKGFEKQATRTTSKLSGFTKSMVSANLATNAITKALNGTIKFLKDSSQAAMDAEEIWSKFDVVFKDNADNVRGWAETYSSSMGLVTSETAEYLATLQDTFVPLGFARDSAADLSVELVKLAGDLSSFNNVARADVVRDLQSALVGNTETLRKYGVVASQAAIEQHALSTGLISHKSELDAAKKAQAIYEITVAATADAQGDLERTLDSSANATRAYEASIKSLSEAVGVSVNETLTPLKVILTDIFNNFTQTIKAANDWKKAQENIASGAGTLYDDLKVLEGRLNAIKVSLESGFINESQVAGEIRQLQQLISQKKMQIAAYEEELAAKKEIEAQVVAASQAEEAAYTEAKIRNGGRKTMTKELLEIELEAARRRAEASKAYHEQELARIEAEKQARVDAVYSMYSSMKSIVQMYYDNEIQAAGDNEEKLAEIREKQFRANKAFAIADTIINTAAAIVKIMDQAGIFGTPLAIAMGALGAAQVALIASTNPSFADGTPPGGYVVPPGYNGDNFPVSAKSGETVSISRAGESSGVQEIVIMLDGMVLARSMTDLIGARQIVIRQEDIVA